MGRVASSHPAGDQPVCRRRPGGALRPGTSRGGTLIDASGEQGCPAPGLRYVSAPLDVPLVSPAIGVAARSVALHGTGEEPAGSLDHLARGVLGRAELAAWHALPPSPRRRRQWLLGRLAARDVVRSLTAAAGGDTLPPEDVVVETGRYGAPYVRVPHHGGSGSPPLISIAHSGETGVALGTTDRRARGVGIDVEVVRSRPALERKGMTPAERSALAALPEPLRAEVALRWWCAKEAAVKALGLGLDRVGGAQALGVTPLGPDNSVLEVAVAASSTCAARTLYAATQCDDGLVVATVLDVRD